MVTLFFSLRQAVAAIAISTMRAVTATTGRVRSVRGIAIAPTNTTSVLTMWAGTTAYVTTGNLSVRFASVHRIYHPTHANNKA